MGNKSSKKSFDVSTAGPGHSVGVTVASSGAVRNGITPVSEKSVQEVHTEKPKPDSSAKPSIPFIDSESHGDPRLTEPTSINDKRSTSHDTPVNVSGHLSSVRALGAEVAKHDGMVNYGYTNTQPPPHIPADNVSVSGSVLEAHLLTGMGAQQVPLAAPEDTADITPLNAPPPLPRSPPPPIPPRPESRKEKSELSAGSTTENRSDETITVEKIEELYIGNRGSYVHVDQLIVEVPEYAVSEPDSEAGAQLIDESLRVLNGSAGDASVLGLGRGRGSMSYEVSELTSAEAGDIQSRMESPVNLPVILEPISIPLVNGSPFVVSKSSSSEVGIDQDTDEDLISTVQEIEWNAGGDVVLIRGTFNNWKKQPMQMMEKGSFAYTFPITRGIAYFYNFVIDDVIRTDPDKEQTKYYVGEKEEDVNTICVD